MKKIFLIISILLLSIQLGYAAQSLDNIVAVVNDDVVTSQELQQYLQLKPGDKKKALNDLINQKLILQVAQRNKITITDRALDDVISDIATRNHLSKQQFYQVLSKQQGWSITSYREHMRKQLLLSRILSQLVGQINVTPQEVNQYIKQHGQVANAVATSSAYHVFDFMIPAHDEAEFMSATDAAKKITQEKSEAHVVNVQKNDLGWRQLNDFPSIFIDSIKNLSVGSFSNPIRAANGMHVLKLEETKSLSHNQPTAGKLTPDQARELVYQKKMDEAAKPIYEKVRKQAYIKIL
jgi:peptidyl-prolyl cis-trans isomerase SurA